MEQRELLTGEEEEVVNSPKPSRGKGRFWLKPLIGDQESWNENNGDTKRGKNERGRRIKEQKGFSLKRIWDNDDHQQKSPNLLFQSAFGVQPL